MNKIDIYNVIHGTGTNCFGEMLFRLIDKADTQNRERLRKGFPEAVDLYMEWVAKGNKFFEERKP